MTPYQKKLDGKAYRQRSLAELLHLCTRIIEKDQQQIRSVLETSTQLQATRKIPVKLFAASGLTALETMTKYLKEEYNLMYHQIATILQRDDRTIWTSYNTALRKQKTRLKPQTGLCIPLLAYRTKKLTVLESTILFLKKNYLLPFDDIALLLNKSKKTVWATYARAKRKAQ